MVKENNKRVMITCTQKTLQFMDELCEVYDMTYTQLIKMLVAKEAAERKKS